MASFDAIGREVAAAMELAGRERIRQIFTEQEISGTFTETVLGLAVTRLERSNA
jgi:hypothetical protein